MGWPNRPIRNHSCTRWSTTLEATSCLWIIPMRLCYLFMHFVLSRKAWQNQAEDEYSKVECSRLIATGCAR
jgi:hypothetical protein